MHRLSANLDPVVEWVQLKSNVLDLGCGDGALLEALREHKSINGLGVEIDHENITACIKRHISVIECDLNDGLSRFDDDSFDTVIMTQTLQAIKRPDLILEEMLRVGRECIVTFPNFGHWQPRWYLASRGRMPVSDYLPYSWYDTPNIHFFTVADFDALCREKCYRVLNTRMLSRNNRIETTLSRWWPSLFAETAIYHLSRS
jgi:methionine biosynthesis protein MetW